MRRWRAQGGPLVGVCLMMLCLHAAAALREDLDLLPLPDGNYLAVFRFHQSLSAEDASNGMFGTFPRAIAHVMAAVRDGVSSFNLSLTRGRYDAERWGIFDADLVAPTGAELVAHFAKDAADAARHWDILTGRLAGLFCASLGQMDAHHTIWTSNSTASSLLARESVCTENLSPFLKLVPCRRSVGGIAALLAPHALFAAPYQLIRIVAHRHADGALALLQTVAVVLPPSAALFGTRAPTCPLADVTTVSAGGDAQRLRVAKGADIVRAARAAAERARPSEWERAPVVVERTLAERSHGNSHLLLHLSNRSPMTVLIDAEQILPRFLGAFAHTLSLNATPSLPPSSSSSAAPPPTAWLVPGGRDGAPSRLLTRAAMSPHSKLTVCIDVRKAFLHFEEHPPDANRGFEVPGASVWATWQRPVGDRAGGRHGDDDDLFEGLFDTAAAAAAAEGGERTATMRLVSAPLLVYLPLPDFSMPYNVITATSTALAVFFGYVFNMLTRRFVDAETIAKEGGWKEKVRRMLRRTT